MNDWRKTQVHTDDSLRSVLEVLNKGSLQVVLVTDERDSLRGTITDGDIRRAILANPSLEQLAGDVMHVNFVSARESDGPDQIAALMRRHMLRHIPILDDQGRVIDLEVLEERTWTKRSDNLVVLMAGGLGTRLRPLTDNCPKPMVEVHGKPILEHIVTRLVAQGFPRIVISVNYLGEMIMDYFRDGEAFDAEISYLREDAPLGTAGSLSLLSERPDKSFMVMNGDLLTRIDHRQFLDFHQHSGAIATMGVRNMDYQVPYGVICVQDNRIAGIEEKPTQRFLVNAGVYAFAPEALDHIPSDQPLDMPDLFQSLLDRGLNAAAFPLHEDWLDVGRPDDLSRANNQP